MALGKQPHHVVSVEHSYRFPQDRQDGDGLDSQVPLWLLVVLRSQYKSCLLRKTSGRTTVSREISKKKECLLRLPQERASSASHPAHVSGRFPCRNGAVATRDKQHHLQIPRLQKKTQKLGRGQEHSWPQVAPLRQGLGQASGLSQLKRF